MARQKLKVELPIILGGKDADIATMYWVAVLGQCTWKEFSETTKQSKAATFRKLRSVVDMGLVSKDGGVYSVSHLRQDSLTSETNKSHIRDKNNDKPRPSHPKGVISKDITCQSDESIESIKKTKRPKLVPRYRHTSEVKGIKSRWSILDKDHARWFDKCWLIYPPRGSVAKAEKAFFKLVKGDVEMAKEIHAGVQTWRKAGKFNGEQQFIPHFSTWLSETMWQDEIEEPNKPFDYSTQETNDKPTEPNRAIPLGVPDYLKRFGERMGSSEGEPDTE
jgi:hypothetical protein